MTGNLISYVVLESAFLSVGTIGALATLQAGVDFGEPDGQPVRRVCVLLSPLDQPGEHLRLLESVACRLRGPT
jgi:mannitol/fructose-specific phosphotransferase system IIA component (Ntr-type)